MISPSARLRFDRVSPKGASKSFSAISSRPEVDAVVGLTVEETVEALRTAALEDRSDVIRGL